MTELIAGMLLMLFFVCSSVYNGLNVSEDNFQLGRDCRAVKIACFFCVYIQIAAAIAKSATVL